MREVTLSTILAALGVVAEANRLAVRRSIGALFELFSAFTIFALLAHLPHTSVIEQHRASKLKAEPRLRLPFEYALVLLLWVVQVFRSPARHPVIFVRDFRRAS